MIFFSNKKDKKTGDVKKTDDVKKAASDIKDSKGSAKAAEKKQASGSTSSSKAPASKSSSSKAVKEMGTMKECDIIKAPRLTEKAAAQNERGVYMFEVLPKATKGQISKAVQQQYGVVPNRVRTARTKGKPVKKRGIVAGRRVERKVAFIYLKKGDTISIT